MEKMKYGLLLKSMKTITCIHVSHRQSTKEIEIYLKNLHQASLYNCMVFAVNGARKSDQSDSISIFTKDGISESVNDVQFKIINNEIVSFSWKPPKHSHGAIQYYFVVVYKKMNEEEMCDQTYVVVSVIIYNFYFYKLYHFTLFCR